MTWKPLDISEADEWIRRRQLQQQIEEELSRRVRDALETPPLERLRRRRLQRKQARMESSANLADPNSHLNLSEKERSFPWRRNQQVKRKNGRKPNPEASTPVLSPSLSGGAASLDAEGKLMARDIGSTNVGTALSGSLGAISGALGGSTEDNMASQLLSSQDPLRDLESCTRRFIPHPKFKNIVCPHHEPFYSYIPYIPGATTFENQVTKYTYTWKGAAIVFDSETSPFEQLQGPNSNLLVAPSLVFESRFESGNLRMARRVGQFEYDLVLRTDMFTRRHTQWYYFSVRNMIVGVTYKFRILNLLKKDSLYNHGMKPLLYSEKDANENNRGWIRLGHHISYGRNVQHLACPFLDREICYFELEWQMEFPRSQDTCYLAHCYPFTFTDLKHDLDILSANPFCRKYLLREVLCHTKAGNSCFLLTVTDFEQSLSDKKCVVITARVHPGETNSSWMMKGVYEFLTSNDSRAAELRRRFVFKIVPMLNPDGVIIGNYRCSLQAKDLNRNFRHPKKESFPTVWHVKELVEQLQNTVGVFVYCDFHGHSRKANVFMYGCSEDHTKNSNIRTYLDERLLPYIISKEGNGVFSFAASKFQVKRSKEATGRVVMYRQMGIKNSYTMEATFSGTARDQEGARHFNQKDFMEAGALFCRGLLSYTHACDSTQQKTQALLQLSEELASQLLSADSSQPEQSVQGDTLMQTSNNTTPVVAATNLNSLNSDGDRIPIRNMNFADEKAAAAAALLQTDSFSKSAEERLDKYIAELGKLSAARLSIESDSSDSDSDPEPEVMDRPLRKIKNKKRRRSKRRRTKKPQKTNGSADSIRHGAAHRRSSSKRQQESATESASSHISESHKRTAAAESHKEYHSKALPTITSVDDVAGLQRFSHQMAELQATSANSSSKGGRASWVNPYDGRKNGGIPCYSEERSHERAAKRMSELQLRMDERSARSMNGWYDLDTHTLNGYFDENYTSTTFRNQLVATEPYGDESCESPGHHCKRFASVELSAARLHKANAGGISQHSKDTVRIYRHSVDSDLSHLCEDIVLSGRGGRWQRLPSLSTENLVAVTRQPDTVTTMQSSRFFPDTLAYKGGTRRQSLHMHTSQRPPLAPSTRVKGGSLLALLKVNPLHQNTCE